MARKHPVIDTITRHPTKNRKNRLNRKATLVGFSALLTLFVTIVVILVVRGTEYNAARGEYATIQTFFEEENTSTTPQTDFEVANVSVGTEASAHDLIVAPLPTPFQSAEVTQLQKDNSDTVGFLYIPGTNIQYPIMQGADNDYYMTRTFKKQKNASGAIFLDCWNMPDFTDFNTVIYGHNMKDGSMFSDLRKYRHQTFTDEHLTVEVTLQNKKLRYSVFAAYTSQGEENADFRGQSCVTETQRSSFIKAARKRSKELDSSITVSRYDRLLTLVTCTGGEHPWFWVVHAVLIAEEL